MRNRPIHALFIFAILIFFLSWEGCSTYDKIHIPLEENSTVQTQHFSFLTPQGVWFDLGYSTLGKRCPDTYNGYCTYTVMADTINPYAFLETERFIEIDEDLAFISYITTQYYADETENLEITVVQYFHRCVEVVEKRYREYTSLYCPAQTENGYKLIISTYDSLLKNDLNTSLYSIKATPVDLVYDYNNDY